MAHSRTHSLLGMTISIVVAAYLGIAPIPRVTTDYQRAANRVAGLPNVDASLIGFAGRDSQDNTPGFSIIKMACEAQASQLLWSGTIPLALRGEETAANVSLAATAIDMAAIHPNETFSFNDVVGIRTEEKGYRSGLMFSRGEVIKGIGGGICVASTLLYKAALESGLKIVERHPHSGPVSYADPGRDAAVSFGLADLRFKNDTGSLIIIRAGVEDDQLTIALYGMQKPGKSVEVISEDYEELPYKIFEKEDEAVPEGQVVVDQKARPGFAVTTLRLVRQNGKVVGREVISHDTVLPRNKVVRIPLKPKNGSEDLMQPAISPEIPVVEHGDQEPPAPSGMITIPEAAEPETSAGYSSSGVPSTASTDASGRVLPTKARTVPNARE